ncbi:MAG: hypothetical protein OXL39_11840 [Caldilineaceae bacterium]|nr:hypothetical protein [Caldilineaceae bacterium]
MSHPLPGHRNIDALFPSDRDDGARRLAFDNPQVRGRFPAGQALVQKRPVQRNIA